jgi:hypothetical protein
MNTIFRIAAAAFLLPLLAQPAFAKDETAPKSGKLSLGVTGGTLGIGPEIGYRINQNVGVRANATFLSFSHTVKSNDVRYDGSADLQSGGASIDVYPFGGGFRLSGGARANGNSGRLHATPMRNTRIGGIDFTPAQIGTITGDAETNNFAPQVTMGYGGTLRRGLSLTVEAGALFQGAVQLRNYRADGSLANNALFIAQLQKEQLRVQDTLDKYKVYPILQIGLKYRL